MRWWLWSIPAALVVAVGSAVALYAAGVSLPGLRRGPVALRTDLAAGAHLGSPVADSRPWTPTSISHPTPPEGEVIDLGARGRAVLSGKGGTLVITAGGKELLRQSGTGLEGWYSWEAEGKTMLWLRYYQNGGATRLNYVLRYDADADHFLPVSWAGAGDSRIASLALRTGARTYLEERRAVDDHHTELVAWGWRGGKLVPTVLSYSYDSAWYPDSVDAVLRSMLSAVGMRLQDETQRYFIDQGQADAFYRVLSGQIAGPGKMGVIVGEALDRAGQQFPFFLDLAGPRPTGADTPGVAAWGAGRHADFYLSLEGSAAMLKDAEGKLRIADLRYAVIPEPVDKGRAADLLASVPEVKQYLGSGPPLLTHGFARWIFTATEALTYEVDSRSGEVYRVERGGQKTKLAPQSVP